MIYNLRAKYVLNQTEPKDTIATGPFPSIASTKNRTAIKGE